MSRRLKLKIEERRGLEEFAERVIALRWSFLVLKATGRDQPEQVEKLGWEVAA
jgi:hypothetical protein